MKFRIFVFGFFFIFWITDLEGQDIAPQVWNNGFVGWDINDRVSLVNTMSFNVLLSDDFPWQETSLATRAVYKVHKNFRITGSFYSAHVRQMVELDSWEVRPVLGLLVTSDNAKRFVISNLSRIEFRYLMYSDDENSFGSRFRNLTFLSYSLNKRSALEDRSLNLFAHAEFFANFNKDLEERFVKLARYKLGLAFRASYHWRFSAGMIYQDSKSNLDVPVVLPTTTITNYIFEWTIGYVFGKGNP